MKLNPMVDISQVTLPQSIIVVGLDKRSFLIKVFNYLLKIFFADINKNQGQFDKKTIDGIEYIQGQTGLGSEGSTSSKR